MNENTTNILVIALSLVMAVGLALIAFNSVQSQQDSELDGKFLATEFSSATDQFSLRHPTEWVIDEGEGNLVTMANSSAALARFDSGLTHPGDIAMSVGFIPTLFFESDELFPGIDIKLEASPKTLLESILPIIRFSSSGRQSAPTGHAQLVTLSNGVEAGVLDLSSDERDGIILVYAITNDVVTFVTASGYPDEVDIREVAIAIAGGIEFSGSTEEATRAFFGS